MSESSDDIISRYIEVTRETALYPEAGSGSIMALAYVGLGLGEAGEVQGKLKKVIRDDNGVITEERRQEILDEVGDIIWYTVRLCDELNVGFDAVLTRNIEKLLDRKERNVIKGSGDKR